MVTETLTTKAPPRDALLENADQVFAEETVETVGSARVSTAGIPGCWISSRRYSRQYGLISPVDGSALDSDGVEAEANDRHQRIFNY